MILDCLKGALCRLINHIITKSISIKNIVTITAVAVVMTMPKPSMAVALKKPRWEQLLPMTIKRPMSTAPAVAVAMAPTTRMRKATGWLPFPLPAASVSVGKSPAWIARAVPRKSKMP
ncbi:hypothetical protein D3C75_809790 [compost metagenome]